ncbi:MAG: hypothetical protein GXZ07_05685 [Firmicutes bacterium]|nr:hypothetical protein [Bacillota bacterium]
MGFIRSQKGSFLVFAVLICTALLMLGTSLMDLSGTDLRITVNQRDGLQAYYLAATGIEIALGILAEHDPFYCGDGEIFFAGGNIRINVSATDQEDGSRQVQIISTGKIGVVAEQIIVQFQSIPGSSGCTDAAALGWYDQESGEIIADRHIGTGAVSLGDPNLSALILNSENDGGALFSAEQVILKSNLVIENDLGIEAGTVVFQKNVHLYPPAGSLSFFHPSGGRVRVYLREEILSSGLLLEPGAYLFPDGFQITGDTSRQDLRCHRVLPVVPGTMVRKAGALI